MLVYQRVPWPHQRFKDLSSASDTENTSSPNPLSPARRSWALIRVSARRIFLRARRGTMNDGTIRTDGLVSGKISRENSIFVMGKSMVSCFDFPKKTNPLRMGKWFFPGPQNNPCLRYPGPLPPAVPLCRRDGIQVLPLQVRPMEKDAEVYGLNGNKMNNMGNDDNTWCYLSLIIMGIRTIVNKIYMFFCYGI